MAGDVVAPPLPVPEINPTPGVDLLEVGTQTQFKSYLKIDVNVSGSTLGNQGSSSPGGAPAEQIELKFQTVKVDVSQSTPNPNQNPRGNNSNGSAEAIELKFKTVRFGDAVAPDSSQNANPKPNPSFQWKEGECEVPGSGYSEGTELKFKFTTTGEFSDVDSSPPATGVSPLHPPVDLTR